MDAQHHHGEDWTDLHSGDLLPISVDHSEVTEEMSPLPVDGVLEARVVGVQVRAVHQHLLAVVQVTDHLRGVITSASKSSIRRFVITEKAPTWVNVCLA